MQLRLKSTLENYHSLHKYVFPEEGVSNLYVPFFSSFCYKYILLKCRPNVIVPLPWPLKSSWWLCTCITLEWHSAFLESSNIFPEDVIPKTLMRFTQIVPVSATTGLGLPLLKSLIRQSLEEQDAIETEGQRSEKLLKLRREIPTSSIPSWGGSQPTWSLIFRFGYGSP